MLVSDVLISGRTDLRTNGMQAGGEGMSVTGTHCSEGAVYAAMNGRSEDGWYCWRDDQPELAQEALDYLGRAILAKSRFRSLEALGTVYTWHDQTLAYQGPQEVLDVWSYAIQLAKADEAAAVIGQEQLEPVAV